MIVRLPDMPIDSKATSAGVTACLFGTGDWLHGFSRELELRVSRVLVADMRRSVDPGEAHSLSALNAGMVLHYFGVADIIAVWCGAGGEMLYLDQWTFAGYALGKYPERMVLGISGDADHPMITGLAQLGDAEIPRCFPVVFEKSMLLAATIERCRVLRSGQDGRVL